MTHGDRIRQMSDEELAQFVHSVACATRFAIDDSCCPGNLIYPFCVSVMGNYCNGIAKCSGYVHNDWLKFIKTEVE